VTNYSIANIPTLYRGRMYRSRLEARWAAFFDRLGWKHEYEPFDLGRWSPDFAITDPFDALIEVKPLTEPDYDLFERVASAPGKSARFVTRVAPVVGNRLAIFGWWTHSYCEAIIVWALDVERPRVIADIFSTTNPPTTWVTCTQGSGNFDGDDPDPPIFSYADYTMGLWADACNAVQWEPRH
jgi:hypothetical protein